MQRLPLKQPNSEIHRKLSRRTISRLALQLGCALVLTGGFVFAAGQHFAAVKYGYESENLRSERQRLLDEQQQLLLEREEVSTPARLESAARQLGLKPLQPGQVGSQKPIRQSQLPMAAVLIHPSASFKR